MSSAAEDLTARARIRDAALAHFGEHGFEKATIRGIAKTAGVSSGLLRHHFGSKEAVRDACDEYVLGIVRKLNEETWAAYEAGDLGKAPSARDPLGPYNRYIARSLIDGGSTELFDEITRMGEAWLATFDARSGHEPHTSARVRAAVVAAWGLAIPMMSEHLARVLGADLSSPQGFSLLAHALLDLHSIPLMSPEEAAAARTGLSEPPASGLSEQRKRSDPR
ncbi:TetR/AcrR family transcriptional regulator [Actinophytocola sp.]|uniref:TetR/AcrR family transcriptional regulator n=1 Tax=Actinophytocola sp. TaxID=1872138 RepID=UPI00389AC8BD